MREKANQELRKYAKENHVFLWELADALKISVESLNRRLRHELTSEQMSEYKKHIDEIAKQ